jgi:hypothetical protein
MARKKKKRLFSRLAPKPLHKNTTSSLGLAIGLPNPGEDSSYVHLSQGQSVHSQPLRKEDGEVGECR